MDITPIVWVVCGFHLITNNLLSILDTNPSHQSDLSFSVSLSHSLPDLVCFYSNLLPLGYLISSPFSTQFSAKLTICIHFQDYNLISGYSAVHFTRVWYTESVFVSAVQEWYFIQCRCTLKSVYLYNSFGSFKLLVKL